MKKRYQYRPAFTLGNALRIGLMVSTCLGSSIGISYAGPEGGVVTGGSATIAQTGNSTNITQHSDRALIDWDSFNIGQHESVNFQQNSSSSIAINRIHDTSPSVILGSLNANGQIMLINTNGVVFGNSAQVDVGGLVVSTAAPTDSDAAKFIAGQTDRLNLSITGNPDAKIINAGNITARDAGLVGFVAPNVINNGIIIANKGSVQLASGDMATVDFYGDGLVEVGVSDAVKNQLIEQNGWVQADGGTVVMTAAAGEQIVNSVINMGGVTQAHSIEQQDGKIILKGDNSTINVTGKIDASGRSANQKGGTITATAKHINLKSGSTIDTSGDKGGGTIKVGGDYKGQGDLHRASTVTMEKDATIYNDALQTGDGGTTILWSDDLTKFAGTITGKGGAVSGDGGFVETSGKKDLLVTGQIDLRASHGDAGTWLLDPTDITIYNRSQGGTDNVNTVTTSYLESQNAHIDLVADNNITIDLTGDTLTLGSGYNLKLTATNGNILTASAGGMSTAGSGGMTLIAGQDISFTHDLDLTAGGSGSVTLQANRNIVYSGGGDITTAGGTITLNSDRDATNGGAISLGTGTEVISNGGHITLGGGSDPTTGEATGVSGYPQGIALSGATLNANGTSSGGNIILNGKGWANSTNNAANTPDDNAQLSAHGIFIKNSSVIQTNYNGTVTLNGTTGGAVTSDINIGVYLHNGAIIRSVNGLISITATSGLYGSNNRSLSMSATGVNTIEALGSGNIDITANTTTGLSIYILGTNDSILNNTGNITITANNGTLDNQIGGIIGSNSATGNITITSTRSLGLGGTIATSGNGTISISSNSDLTGPASGTISSVNGLISLTAGQDISFANDLDITSSGTGSVTLRANRNIVYSGGGDITTAGGTITLNSDRDATNGGAIYLGTGTEVTSNGGHIILGGGATPSSVAATGISGRVQGIRLEGAIIDARGPSTTGGNITMNGAGWSGSTVAGDVTNAGVGINLYTATVRTNNSGTITMNGTGGGTGSSDSNLGIFVFGGSTVRAVNGLISLTGAGGTGSGGNNVGIAISSNGANIIYSTGSGDIDIKGTAGSVASSASLVLNAGTTSTGVFSTSGNITLTGLPGVSGGGIMTSGGGASATIGGANATGTISLIANTISYEATTIPAIQTTGNVIIRPYSAATTVGIGTGSSAVQITDAMLSKITAGTLWLGGYGLTGLETGFWNSSSTVTLNTTRSFAYNVNIISGASIISGADSTITLTGGANATLSAVNDVNITHDLDITASGTGSVNLRANRNVIYTAAGDISTNGGTITLNSDRDALNGGAIYLGIGTALVSNGGHITLGGGADPANTATTGLSGYGAGINLVGANIDARGASTTGGNITMTGTGWAASTVNDTLTSAHGIMLNGSTVQTNNSGAITLTGTGGGTSISGGNIGIYLYNNTRVTGVNGIISLTGTGGTGGIGGSHGIAFSSVGTNKVESLGSGAISLSGTSSTAYSNSIVMNSSTGGVLSTTGTVGLIGISTGTGGITFNSGTIGGGSASGAISLTSNRYIYLGGTTSTTGNGTITMNATTQISSVGTLGITSVNGTISLTGSSGIILDHAATITSTAGNVTLNNDVTSSVAQTFQAGGILTAGAITMGTNNLTLTANDMVLNGNLTGTGTLTLQQYAATRIMNIGTGTDDNSSLHLGSGDLSKLVDGWSLINLGRTDNNTVVMNVGTTSWTDAVNFRSNYSKNISGALTLTGGAATTLTFTNNADLKSTITTDGGAVNVTSYAYGYGGTITTNGGAVTIGNLITYSTGAGLTINSGNGNISFGTIGTNTFAANASRSFVFNAGTGTVAFGGVVDTDASISATANTITFNGAWGGTRAVGDVSLTSVSSMSLPSITTAAGKNVSATVTGASNTLTAAAITAGTSGNITLTADDMILNGNLSGTGTLTLQQYAPNRIVNIGTGTDNNSSLHLGSGDLSKLVNGWGLINLGRTDGNNFMYIGATSWTDAVNFRSNYSKNISGALTLTGGATTSLTITNNADLHSTITTDGGAVNITSNAYGYGGSITTSGGAVTIGNLVTYDASAGLSVNSGNGNISIGAIGTSSFIANASRSFVFNAGTGTVAFGGAVETDGSVTASGSGITFNGAWGGIRPLGDVTLTSASSISLPSITTAAGKTVSATVTGAGNYITASSIATGTSGNITLTADDLVLNGALSGTGTLTLQPYATNRTVNVTIGTDDHSSFHLSTTDLTRFTNGWSGINVGRVDNTGDMTISTSGWTDPVTFLNNYRMTLSGALTASGDASVTFTGGANGYLNQSAAITTAGQNVTMNLRNLNVNGTANITTAGGQININNRIYLTSASSAFTYSTSGGNISIGGPINDYLVTPTGQTLTFNAGSGTLAFGGSPNTAANLSATAGTITFNGDWGGLTPLGTISLTSASSITLPSITANSIFIRANGATSDITIASGKALTSSGANGITLVAGRNFINSAGSGALVANGSGRWLVYSTDVTGTTGEEDLSNNFNRYSCTYGSTCPTLGTGNGLLYSYTPVLTATPSIANTVYGNNASGLSGYIYSLSGYLGSDGSSDSVTGSLTGVTDYVIGNDVGSYYLNYSSGTLASAMGYGFTYANKANGVNVTPRVLTASLTGTITKVYNDDTDAALIAGNYLLSNVYNNEDVSLGNITAGTYDNENVGTGKSVSVSGLVLNGTKAGNYTLASNNISGNIGTITPKGLTVTATAGQNKTYGQSDGVLGYTYSGLVGNDSSATFTGALSRTAGNNAGLYAISQGNLAATGNYTVTSFVTDNYTINKATINITAPSGSRYYGYDNPNYTWSNATITGLQYGETGAVLDNLSFNIAGSATPTANAGTTHAVSLGGFSDNNYTLGSFTGGLLTIAKAPLTITADSYIRVMIMPLPTLTASYSGLRNGETSSVVSGLSLTTGDSNNAAFGSYQITVSGGTAANYNITRVNGTATVTAGALPATIANPVAVVQPAPGNNVTSGGSTVSTKDPVALLDEPVNIPLTMLGQTSNTLYTQNDPLVTFTPELREILGI